MSAAVEFSYAEKIIHAVQGLGETNE
jgi:hypothetical protein